MHTSLKQRCFLLRRLALGLLALFALAPNPRPAHADTFAVSGSQILRNGSPFVIKGANVNGASWVWSRDEVNATGTNGIKDIDLITNVWQFNAVRINCGWFTDDANFTKLYSIVDAYAGRGVVAMISIHDPAPGVLVTDTSTPSLTALTDWWKKIATHYKGTANQNLVWFNIKNEAEDSANNVQWLTMHDTICRAIRSDVGVSNVIVCDGNYWGQEVVGSTTADVTDAQSAILTYGPQLEQSYGNIVFSFHPYEGWNLNGTTKMANYVDRVRNVKGLPIIAGEYGMVNNWNDTTPATEALYKALTPRGVGYMVWHYYGGDGNSLVNVDQYQGGSALNRTDGSRPTNLTWLGEKVWDDIHGTTPPNLPAGTPLGKSGWTAIAKNAAGGDMIEGSNSPALAVDGNYTTAWHSGTSALTGGYFQIDMGVDQTFNEIVLDPRDGNSPLPAYEVWVQPSGGSWTQVASGSGNAQSVVRIPFASIAARSIQIRFKADSPNGQWYQFAEVDVYAPASGSGSAPYSGTPIALPGTIDAENYDKGGEGVGYHQTNGGGQTAYRSDNSGAVYVDAAASNGYGIGWTAAAQWTKYSVNVASSATYTLTFRVAGFGGTFHLEDENATNLTGTVTAPSTGSWSSYATVAVTGVSLRSGSHALKLVQDSGGYNLDSIAVTATTTTAGALSGSGSPITSPITVDLTADGPSDWAHWGQNGTSFDHKAGVTPLISNYLSLNGSAVYGYGDNLIGFSWSDGTPTGSASGTTTGVYASGLNNGFSFTIAAGTSPKTAKIYVGGFQATGTFTAHLSDGSAPDYVDNSFGSAKLGNTDGQHFYAVYSLAFNAAADGQTLTLTWRETGDTSPGGNNGAVTLQAVSDPPAKPAAVLSAPVSLRAQAGAAMSKTIRLTWTYSTCATSYSLYRSTGTAAVSTTAYKSGLTSPYFTDTGLTAGTRYNYKVAAVNGRGTGAQCTAVSAVAP